MSLLSIVEETDDHLVLNKPGELVCHPTKGDYTSSLIGRVRHYLGEEVEARFINRLDRETSGLVVLSKGDAYHKSLYHQMERSRKLYWAVVEGQPEGEAGTIDQPLGKDEVSPVVVKQAVRPDGRASRTHWKVLSRAHDCSLLEVELETGRMHQIRVHMAWLGHPVVGDKLYGPDETLYLELAEHSWTDRLRAALPTERHLLSSTEIITDHHHWKATPPDDLVGYREWGVTLPTKVSREQRATRPE